MKIIGKTSDGFLLEVRADDLAHLLGYYAAYSTGCPDWKIGMEIDVDAIWERLYTLRKSEEVLASCAKSLQNLAELLEPIDNTIRAALKDQEEDHAG